jgi:enoyl-CoA hydratase/carnithine racemase
MANQAAAYGYINRAMPDGDLDEFVETLATRTAKFDKWRSPTLNASSNTSLPPDV